MINNQINIAFFVSPHGFGHAARACAVMNAIQKKVSKIKFHIFTTIPEWFFKESITNNYQYNFLKTDIGLEQKNAFEVDLAKTINSLDIFLPFNNFELDNLRDYLMVHKCKLVICDIAPLGIVVADKANIPSILIENFTWDWIYEPFSQDFSEIQKHIEYYKSIFNFTTFRIQTEPVCNDVQNVDLNTFPVSRTPKNSSLLIRNKLNICNAKKMILITMGGIPSNIKLSNTLNNNKNFVFVIPGNNTKTIVFENIIYLPHHSNLYHPDLVNASNLVVAKVGYSTIAEAYHANIPIGYIPRAKFRESSILVDFINKEMVGNSIFLTNNNLCLNIHDIEQLLDKPITHRNKPNGAEQISEFVINLID